MRTAQSIAKCADTLRKLTTLPTLLPSRFLFGLLAVLGVFTVAASSLRAEVVISEFLAENDNSLRDADGDSSDWIELHNNGETFVSMAGWSLTDQQNEPQRWPLPTFSLQPGERRVIFASGKDRRNPLEELHTNFSLQNGSGYLALRKPGGIITSQWNPYPPQKADISFGDGTLVDRQDLVTTTSGGKYFVPANGSLGTTWTSAAFDDATWAPGSSRLGYQTGATPPGLPIAYWTFDDTTANRVPGGPALTSVSAAYNSAIPSAVEEGKSLHFSRSASSYATANIDVSETSYTVSFWFKTTSLNAGLFAVHQSLLGLGGHDRHIFLKEGNIGVRIHSNEALLTTGMNYADDQWHHVAHVYGGTVGGQKVYVDGVQVLSGVKAMSDFTWQDRITIGYSNDATSGSQYLEGEIDDLAIWSEALVGAAVESLAAGADPMQISAFTPYIGTDVGTAMKSVNPSIYARYPFTVNRQTPLNSLILRVRYDDAFVAYLDGVEIARSGLGAEPAFNSVADVDRTPTEATTVEEIDISVFAASLTNGTHVLAVQGLNDAVGSNEFLLNVELSGANLSPASSVHMDPPTPGQPNTTGFAGFVADTQFSPKRGFYDAPQQVSITCPTLGTTIAYTTDGTDPSPTNGTQVPAASAQVAPAVTIPVTGNTILRAMAYRAGLRSTNIDAATYLFPRQIAAQSNVQPGFNPQWSGRVADYGMDPNIVNTTLPGYGIRESLMSLPSVSLTCKTGDLFDAPSGIYYNPSLRGPVAERKVSVEWINPDGTPGWHVQAGARMQGNSSRNHNFGTKHAFRLNFRGIYGTPKLKRDLFGGDAAEEFDQLVLRSCSTDSFPVVDGGISDGEIRWTNETGTYLRDQFMRDTLNDLGWKNPHSRYCHLYVNGLYWGLYNLCERPIASYFAETFGGDEDEWDVLKNFGPELNNGTAVAWNEMMAICNDQSSDAETQAQKLIGNNPDGTRNPAFEVYVNLDAFIDYMIVHIAAGAEDWPDNNFFAGRRRGPESDGFRFVIWDQEITNNSLTRKSGRGSANSFETVGDLTNQSQVDRKGPAAVYDTFRRAPSIQKRFRDRVQALLMNHGPLSPGANRARWALRQAEIDKAIVAESARWGDAMELPAKRRETHWLQTMDYMNRPVTGYWDAILPIDIQRFRNAGIYPSIDAPLIYKTENPNATEVYLSSDQSFVYYTLDGTDPMGADGLPSADAYSYIAGVEGSGAIASGDEWRYLVTPAEPAAAWKQTAFDDSAWAVGVGQFGYGDGDEATAIGFGGNPNARYLTTYFRKKLTLSKIPHTVTLRLLRDDGAVIYVNGKEVVRSNMHPTKAITYASTASTNASGADESSLYYEFNLSPADFVAGENVVAVEVHKVSATDDDLSFDASLYVTTTAAPTVITLPRSAILKTRALSATGEWSGLATEYFTVDAQPADSTNLVISEIHYHPADPTTPAELAISTDAEDYEFIEFMNISEGFVDLGNVFFSAGLDFQFPDGFTLFPGERCVVVKNAFAFKARYGEFRFIIGEFQNGTGLSNSGEALALSRTDNGVTTLLRSFAYDDAAPWPLSPDGNGPSLVLMSPMTNPDPRIPSNWVASPTSGGTPSEAFAPSFVSAFSQWSGANGGNLNPTGDDDRDGISNAMEFALALDPRQPNRDATPKPRVVSLNGRNYLSLTARHAVPGNGFAFQVESSDDLVKWTAESDVVLISRLDHGDGTVTESWRCARPADGQTRQFLRMRANVSQ